MADQTTASLLTINADVFHEICTEILQDYRIDGPQRDTKSLTALSSCCKALRATLAPQVFRTVKISIPKTDHDRQLAMSALNTMWLCELATAHTVRCDINIRSGGPVALLQVPARRTGLRALAAKLWKSKSFPPLTDVVIHPPPELAPTLVSFIAGLACLETLALALPTGEAQEMQRVCEKARVLLPTVKSLSLGPGVEWFIARCPNARMIATHPCAQWDVVTRQQDFAPLTDLLNAANRVPDLQRLESSLFGKHWIEGRVFDAVPDVAELHLPVCTPVQVSARLIWRMQQFSKLRHLRFFVSTGGESEPVDEPWEWCGAYDGPDEQWYYARMVTEPAESSRRTVQQIAEACTSLETIRVSSSISYIVERTVDGRVSLEEVQKRGSLRVLPARTCSSGQEECLRRQHAIGSTYMST